MAAPPAAHTLGCGGAALQASPGGIPPALLPPMPPGAQQRAASCLQPTPQPAPAAASSCFSRQAAAVPAAAQPAGLADSEADRAMAWHAAQAATAAAGAPPQRTAPPPQLARLQQAAAATMPPRVTSQPPPHVAAGAQLHLAAEPAPPAAGLHPQHARWWCSGGGGSSAAAQVAQNHTRRGTAHQSQRRAVGRHATGGDLPENVFQSLSDGALHAAQLSRAWGRSRPVCTCAAGERCMLRCGTCPQPAASPIPHPAQPTCAQPACQSDSGQ